MAGKQTERYVPMPTPKSIKAIISKILPYLVGYPFKQFGLK